MLRNGLHNTVLQIRLAIAMAKRSLAMQKLVDNDSKSPNISLLPVNIMNQTLRRHIEWRSNIQIFETLSLSVIYYL